MAMAKPIETAVWRPSAARDVCRNRMQGVDDDAHLASLGAALKLGETIARLKDGIRVCGNRVSARQVVDKNCARVCL